MCIRTTHVYKDNTCVCGQHMCIWARHVYMDKTCAYGQDMCIRTTHVYKDNTYYNLSLDHVMKYIRLTVIQLTSARKEIGNVLPLTQQCKSFIYLSEDMFVILWCHTYKFVRIHVQYLQMLRLQMHCSFSTKSYTIAFDLLLLWMLLPSNFKDENIF